MSKKIILKKRYAKIVEGKLNTICYINTAGMNLEINL